MAKGPRPALAAVIARTPVVLADAAADEPCAAARLVTFVAEDTVRIGDPVHVVPVDGHLWIISGTARIGRLAVAAPELAVCIQDGWAFSGVVLALDGETVTATIAGVLTD